MICHQQCQLYTLTLGDKIALDIQYIKPVREQSGKLRYLPAETETVPRMILVWVN